MMMMTTKQDAQASQCGYHKKVRPFEDRNEKEESPGRVDGACKFPR